MLRSFIKTVNKATAPKRTGQMILLALVVTMGPGTFVSPVTAGSLRGRITINGATPIQESAVNPYAGTLGSVPHSDEGAHQAQEAELVVIYLTGETRSQTDKPNTTPQLAQINQSFEPKVLGISVGTTVEFPNRDPVFHNVFSYSKPKRFDLGYYGKNASKHVRFDKPGLVKVFCDIHTSMSAYIYVVDTPYVTQPDSNGIFELNDLPPGDYQLNAWHPTKGLKTITISVGERATEIDINL